MAAKSKGVIVLASGGTGGHLFPAQALAEELSRRGFDVHLMTDGRVREYGKKFPAKTIYEVTSATITPKRPWQVPGQLMKLFSGYRSCKDAMLQMPVRPRAVVGFGGYPSIPPLLAALRLGIPVCIHEQNAVMGRANRFLAGRVNAIAASFPKVKGVPQHAADKVVVTGNPVRDQVLQQAKQEYEEPSAEKPFNLLVFGGSQGARFFSQMMPEFVRELPQAVRRKLHVVQQCRSEDMEEVQAAYTGMKLKATLAPFFPDMAKRIAASHLVICRSGASSIAELAVLGRPAVLVPLPHSIDNDQMYNAQSFVDAGSGWLMTQDKLVPEDFAALFTRLRYQVRDLVDAAYAARKFGRPDAAVRLADLVERIAHPAHGR